MLSVGIDQKLRRVAINLLRFRQDRGPVTTADFSSVLVNLEGASDADGAQQEIGIEKSKVRSCRKAQQQEQYPQN